MRPLITLASCLLLSVSALVLRSAPAPDLAESFAHPPASARPWVYWFWSNGNITDEGITADLEAMQRVGIGGVLIMDVVDKFAPPPGEATYMGDLWQTRFKHALKEAARLGLEVRMTNGPGWTGSSGPWITPELSMQKLVTTDTAVTGPVRFDAVLPAPDSTVAKRADGYKNDFNPPPYYRDVAVFAFPKTPDGEIAKDAVVDLTSKMGADGRLVWDAPAGDWIIQRVGCASTGSSTRPPVLGGNGLEVDKLSASALDVHFAGQMGRLIDLAGPLAGRVLTGTHIDSWEVGAQTWTPRFREEFTARRGYDPLPWLPAVTATRSERINNRTVTTYLANVGGRATADRFRWDYHQTISELLAQNYSGHLAELAHRHGLELSIEGYNLNFGDEATYSAAADEPMTEFWTPSRYGAKETQVKGRQMASVAHVYGRKVVGAEAFTSDQKEEWRLHPALLKAQGDFQFAQGVNRFVFHRYAHQPWLDRAPGATMGPWGLHYERTNTWWEYSGAWHAYLARCQTILQQGLYVADLLYLRPQVPNLGTFNPTPAPPAGYRYDEISAEALIARVTVRDGRLTLPDGMSYRLLVLPPDKPFYTPALVRKFSELVAAGAAVLGPRPERSPSLSGQPAADAEVKAVAAATWGPVDGKTVVENVSGTGRVFTGIPVETVLSKLNTPPDFTSDAEINWIHRRIGDADIYFVANPSATSVTARMSFRVTDRAPEIWNPEIGERAFASAYTANGGRTELTLDFDPAGSRFIVFRSPASEHPSLPGGTNTLALKSLAKLDGPWTVRFDPAWGGPAETTFDTLRSWTDSADAGVRYYSGTARYEKTFDFAPPAGIEPDAPVLLDLGDVQVMARVSLNDRDLGVVWKAPYRINLAGAIRPGVNRLVVSVVNLWPNRMIGDASQPGARPFTFSTWNPFKSDTPLLPSGLLGPVELLTESPSKQPLPSTHEKR